MGSAALHVPSHDAPLVGDAIATYAGTDTRRCPATSDRAGPSMANRGSLRTSAINSMKDGGTDVVALDRNDRRNEFQRSGRSQPLDRGQPAASSSVHVRTGIRGS
jgi:hypothetical protein